MSGNACNAVVHKLTRFFFLYTYMHILLILNKSSGIAFINKSPITFANVFYEKINSLKLDVGFLQRWKLAMFANS